nr:hypothetical protein [Tanacetum cinerariifolium]
GRGGLGQNVDCPAPHCVFAVPLPRNHCGQRHPDYLAQQGLCRLHLQRAARAGRGAHSGAGHGRAGGRPAGRPVLVPNFF